MHPSRNMNEVSSAAGENHPMFLRQLSSVGSSVLPHGRPALCRAGFRSSTSSYRPHYTPAPPPWCLVRGFPPRPPHLPRFPPAVHHQVVPGRPFRPRIITPPGSWRPFSTSAGVRMEQLDREPPHKRRKGAEDRGGGGGGGQAKDGDGRPRPNHRFKDGSGGRGKNKDVGRTKAGNKDGAGRDETPNRGGTQTPDSAPEQDKVATHRPNPWFREGRGAERTITGPEGQLGDRSGVPTQPCSSTHPPNPWKVADNRTPPPPGTCPPPPGTFPPDGQQEDMKPAKSLQRHWEASPVCSTDPRPPGGSRAFDFSVMCYNILSQELLQDNAYLYRHCSPGVLPWDHRLPNLLAEIRQHDADILCLQEVQEDHYENQIKPALQALGYQCEYKKRTGSKPDGCAVIFKSSRLSLLSSNPVEYFRRGDALLDRDNVGLVVLLRPNDAVGQSDPSAFVCVANTHLLYNPRRGDIKLAQLAILLAEIGRLSCLPDGSTNPVVLCGDFNSTPHSPLYRFLTTGCLKYRGLQIGMVSGQESSPKGQRLLKSPLWSQSLGINHWCRYEDEPTAESSPSPSGSPTAVEGAISNLTVEDVANRAAAASFNRSKIRHSLKLQSSYQHRLKPDGRPEITTCHSRTATTVDYILYTPESITPPSLPGGRGLQLLGRLSLVGQLELKKVKGLPNQCHSSDHLPLLARFRFRRPEALREDGGVKEVDLSKTQNN